tara:strand:- start:257 stop:982 length:726 start_codon:yes stop_codon:yes gene_type:complete
MKKSYIQDCINKYHLGGKCESVVWDVKNGKVNIDFATDTKDTVGNISFNLDVSNCDLPISFTSSLLRLLAITDEDVMLELITHETGLPTKLKISDNKFDLNYHLGELDIIEKVPSVNEIEYDFSWDLNDEFISNFVKAHNALEKTPQFTLNTTTTPQGEDVVELVLGERTQHANKVKFTELLKDTNTLSSELLPFSATVFREILTANRGCIGKIQVSTKGLAKIEFETEGCKVEYFMVRMQ